MSYGASSLVFYGFVPIAWWSCDIHDIYTRNKKPEDPYVELNFGWFGIKNTSDHNWQYVSIRDSEIEGEKHQSLLINPYDLVIGDTWREKMLRVCEVLSVIDPASGIGWHCVPIVE